jgi:hypothetical protein
MCRVDAQDVALAWMLDGRDGLSRLYSERAVSPEVSAEAWDLLHTHKRTGDDLAVFLAAVHLPLRACEAPSLGGPKTLIPEA